jgi:hypothetical protein
MRMQLQDGGYVEVYKDDDCTIRVLLPSEVNMTVPESLQVAAMLRTCAEAAQTEIEHRAGTFRVQIPGTKT